jgi:hypothetical protein
MNTAKQNRERVQFVNTKTTKEMLGWCDAAIEAAVKSGRLYCCVYYNLNTECIKILKGMGYKVTDNSTQRDGDTFFIEW